MALSNMLKEPRREIIETIFGLAVVVPLSYADYCAAVWAQGVTGGDYGGMPWQLGMLVIFAALVFVIVLLFWGAIVIHIIGELVCAAFKRIGADPRPTRRYR